MQPDLAGSLAAKRKQPVVPLISSATVEAAARRRADQVTVEPLGQAAGEGSQFSLMAGEPCLELSDPARSSKRARQSSAVQSQALKRRRASTPALCWASALTSDCGGGPTPIARGYPRPLLPEPRLLVPAPRLRRHSQPCTPTRTAVRLRVELSAGRRGHRGHRGDGGESSSGPCLAASG
jgi:hypothetical protein